MLLNLSHYLDTAELSPLLDMHGVLSVQSVHLPPIGAEPLVAENILVMQISAYYMTAMKYREKPVRNQLSKQVATHTLMKWHGTYQGTVSGTNLTDFLSMKSFKFSPISKI